MRWGEVGKDGQREVSFLSELLHVNGKCLSICVVDMRIHTCSLFQQVCSRADVAHWLNLGHFSNQIY